MIFVNVIKPTHRCNLACTYCYNEDVRNPLMSLETLDRTISETFDYAKQMKCFHGIDFVWHGGEPMMAGVDFYDRVVELQKLYASDMPFTNVIQTNGTLINNKWIDFFIKNDFLVSVSIDGPKELHDKNRIDLKGQGSFDRVMSNIKKLQESGLYCGSALVINKSNIEQVEDIYHFMVKHHIPFNVIPIMMSGGATENYDEVGLAPDEYAKAWIKLYDIWFNARKETYIHISDFVTKTQSILAGRAADCVGLAQCSNANISTDPLGDIYPCASLSGIPDLIIGNLLQQSLSTIMNSDRAIKFRTRKPSESCLSCKWQHVCHGGCQARAYKFFARDYNHKDYYCPSLYKMYEHVEKRLAEKKLKAGLPYSNHATDGLENTMAYVSIN